MSENAKKRGFQQGENAKNRVAEAENVIRTGISRLGGKTNLKVADYYKLISDPDFFDSMEIKNGVPYFGWGKRSGVKDPKTRNSTKEEIAFMNEK